MLTLLRKRRSIRKYTKQPVDALRIKRLKEALLRSPSSRDIKPWHFVFIDDPRLLRDLSRCKAHGAEFLANAPLGVVLCGDETKSDVWIEDCSIAAILLQMAALEVGLGSCWIQVRNRSTKTGMPSETYVQDLLRLPRSHRILCIIALGHPAEKKKPVPAKKLLYTRIYRNVYRND